MVCMTTVTAAVQMVRRRSLVLGTLAAGGAALTGCSTTEGSTAPVPRVLLAYFSRAGENYHYGDRIDLEVGNTGVLAGLIADRIDCALHRIEAADPYSDDYDATVRRNVEEQDTDARPDIASALPAVDGYDVVLLASPIWNVRPPMIMKTFAESLVLAGKTVHPVVTYAVSGLGNAERDYAEACLGASLAQGLAVQGEEVADSGPDIDAWLTDTGLAT